MKVAEIVFIIGRSLKARLDQILLIVNILMLFVRHTNKGRGVRYGIKIIMLFVRVPPEDTVGVIGLI